MRSSNLEGCRSRRELCIPSRLKLESGGGASVAIKFEGRGIVERDMFDVEVYAFGQLDIGERLLNYRQGLEAEEVHFDKPRLLNHRTLILSGNHFRAVGIRSH